jgi:ABC-type multidrug transport system fused ATPase/permease subunit
MRGQDELNQKTGIRSAIAVLDKIDQRKMFLVSVLQILLSVLDLIGVLAIGLLGALSVTGLQSGVPDERVSRLLSYLHLNNLTFQQQVMVLGLGAVILLVGRTFLSIFSTRKVLFFMSRRGAKLSANLVARLLAQPLLKVESRTTQEILFAVTTGVSLITLQVLAPLVVLISDVALLIVMALGLFTLDPTTAIGTLVVFSLIGFSLHKFMHTRAGNLGRGSTDLVIKSNEKIIEVFSSYREAVVRNRRDYYAREIGSLRFAISDIAAEIYFLPYISKYIIEIAVIVGAVFVGATAFVLQDAIHAISTLAVFLAAGTRIAPAVLRVQQGFVSIKRALGEATPTIKLVEDLRNSNPIVSINDNVDVIHEGFKSEIEVKDVSLTYPKMSSKAISNITLTIPAGASVAFVGPSGAGKTTIIDILLGVLEPDEGEVIISGLPPLEAVAKWPGSISYVPQDVIITSGSFRDNVTLGYPITDASDDLVMSALEVAHLDEFVLNLPQGIDTQVGERGAKISGGQRQRLGIARAMFTRPMLLVLDEATSALDGETEANISDAVHALRGSTTVVVIAHRLSTVRNADIVVYMDGGKVLARGTFDEVRAAVPNFNLQAKLMGL